MKNIKYLLFIAILPFSVVFSQTYEEIIKLRNQYEQLKESQKRCLSR